MATARLAHVATAAPRSTGSAAAGDGQNTACLAELLLPSGTLAVPTIWLELFMSYTRAVIHPLALL